jgi:hypothetical protein
MAGPIERFERWRIRQAVRTADLARRVLDEVVPLYETSGFSRFDDYAGGDLSVVGANTIALQRRSGERWPTVEVQFHRKGRASFNIIFAELPEVCYRWTSGSPVAIDRKDANVLEGGEWFTLCKGLQRDFDCTFGVPTFAIFPGRLLARDLELAKNRSRILIELLNSGIPKNWSAAPPGYVSEFVFKVRNYEELR